MDSAARAGGELKLVEDKRRMIWSGGSVSLLSCPSGRGLGKGKPPHPRLALICIANCFAASWGEGAVSSTVGRARQMQGFPSVHSLEGR